MASVTTTNLRDINKLTEAELEQLLRRRYVPEAATPEQEAAVASVAEGIAMHRRHTDPISDDEHEARYRAAAELAEEPETQDGGSNLLDAVFVLACMALIGLGWVLFR